MGNIRSFVPQSVIDLGKYIFRKSPILIGNYKTFSAAKLRSSNYSNKELIIDAYEKTELYKNTLNQNTSICLNSFDVEIISAFGLLDSENDNVNVLDFGGSFGKYFFLVRQLLNKKLNVYWDVLETKSLCEVANSKITNKNLKFYSKFELIMNKSYDIVIFSGALQYLESPVHILKKIFELNPQLLIINRIPLINSYERYCVQKINLQDNGPQKNVNMANTNIKVPICLLNKKKLIRILQEKFNKVLLTKNSKYSLLYRLSRISTYCYICFNPKNNVNK